MNGEKGVGPIEVESGYSIDGMTSNTASLHSVFP